MCLNLADQLGGTNIPILKCSPPSCQPPVEAFSVRLKTGFQKLPLKKKKNRGEDEEELQEVAESLAKRW